MRRSIPLVPFLVFVVTLLAAAPSGAQVSPGLSGGNSLAPASESAPAPTRVSRFQRLERTTAQRLSTFANRAPAPPRLRFALADYRMLLRFLR